jgi:hypothetical protein
MSPALNAHRAPAQNRRSATIRTANVRSFAPAFDGFVPAPSSAVLRAHKDDSSVYRCPANTCAARKPRDQLGSSSDKKTPWPKRTAKPGKTPVHRPGVGFSQRHSNLKRQSEVRDLRLKVFHAILLCLTALKRFAQRLPSHVTAALARIVREFCFVPSGAFISSSLKTASSLKTGRAWTA